MSQCKINIFTVSGKINKWDIIKSEFTLGTPVGDIKINISLKPLSTNSLEIA